VGRIYETLKISQNRLGRELLVPPRRINEIVHGKRAVTAEPPSV
jgi:plasmid maintenance system antidote protein VapI